MNNNNKPKFKIGDIVVISIYGTVGTITKLHQIEQHFVYEVNHGEVLFFENALQLVFRLRGYNYRDGKYKHRSTLSNW